MYECVRAFDRTACREHNSEEEEEEEERGLTRVTGTLV